MTRIATLSLPAFEVLWEDLRVGGPPHPLEIPHYGDTLAERARIRAAVHVDLEQRGLVRRGRPEPELEDALRLLAKPDLRVVAMGMPSVEDSVLLRASLVARGGYAVLFVQHDLSVSVTLVRDNAFAAAVVGVLPPRRRGPGKPVTVPASALERGRGDPGDLAVLRAMVSEPMVGTGHFRVGDEVVTWFDTRAGRYVNVPARDGWLTVAPADNQDVARHVGRALAEVGRRPGAG